MKSIKNSLLAALGISFGCFAANLLSDALLGVMIPAVSLTGGELDVQIGFGWIRETYYPLTTVDAPAEAGSRLYFSVPALLCSFAAVLALVLIIGAVRRRMGKK